MENVAVVKVCRTVCLFKGVSCVLIPHLPRLLAFRGQLAQASPRAPHSCRFTHASPRLVDA